MTFSCVVALLILFDRGGLGSAKKLKQSISQEAASVDTNGGPRD